jgi:hypothetical protein
MSDIPVAKTLLRCVDIKLGLSEVADHLLQQE